MAQEPVLTFENFTADAEGIPYYDNFPLFFWNGALAEYYRNLHPYKELHREAPDLEKKLRDGISQLHPLNTKTLEPFKQELYKAYLIMRKYVTSDTELGLPVPLPR